MKIKTLLIGATALGFATAAHAQTVTRPTVVNITGATAFRTAAHNAIVQGFTGNLTVGSISSNTANANQVIYRGTFTGVNGTTTIRTSWTGSVEGVRALAAPTDKAVQDTEYLSLNATFSGTVASPTILTDGELAALNGKNEKADFAFSDAAVASTPYAKAKLGGGPVGVIVFAPVVNKGSNANITNVTTQQLRELFRTGELPLSRFTGVTSDNSTKVFNVHRYDGSGTRVIAQVEAGYGAASKAIGYAFREHVLTNPPEKVLASANESAYAIYGVNNGNRVSASSDFNKTLDVGNGGYISGGSIAGLMTQNGSVNILSILGSGDTRTAKQGGGRVLSYNGEILSGLAGGTLSEADKDKVRTAKYTLWSFENIFSSPAAPVGNKGVIFNYLKNQANYTDAKLTTGGVSIASLAVTRTAPAGKGTTPDGGLIGPK
jgi:hypothetical protein